MIFLQTPSRDYFPIADDASAICKAEASAALSSHRSSCLFMVAS